MAASGEGGKTRTGQLIGRGVGGSEPGHRGCRATGAGTKLLLLLIPCALQNILFRALCSTSHNTRDHRYQLLLPALVARLLLCVPADCC